MYGINNGDIFELDATMCFNGCVGCCDCCLILIGEISSEVTKYNVFRHSNILFWCLVCSQSFKYFILVSGV